MFSLGAILQKKGVTNLPEIKFKNIIDSLKGMIKNRVWVTGIIIGTAGGLPYFLSQGFIGVALAQPLQGTGLLFVALFAIKWLKESLKRSEKIGIAILIFAPIFLSLGAVSNTAVKLTDPNFHLSFIIFYIICLTGIVLTFLIYKKSTKLVSENLALNSGIFFGVGAMAAQLGVLGIWPLISNPLIISINPLFFDFRPKPDFLIAGIGLTVVLAGNAIATFVVSIAYQKGKAAIIVPIQSTGNLLIPVVGGVLVFNQVIGNSIVFFIGIALLLFGALLLARLQASTQAQK